MENAPQLFSYNEYPVRVVKHGQPPTTWFVAKDVCDILGYTNSRKALDDHLDDDEKNTVTISDGNRGNPNMNIINESGLYCLILRSNMPKAKEFRKWVTATVLPQVMQNGLPVTQDVTPAQVDPMQAAKLIFEAAKIKDNQLALALDRVAKHYTGQSMLALAGIPLIAPTNHQLLTPTQIGRHFGVSGQKINALLLREGYQRKVGKTYEPLELGEPFAVMQDVGRPHSDGTPIRQLKWDSSILDEISDLLGELPFTL